MDENKDEIVEILVTGLLTDGGHHKQWALEQALIKLIGQEKYDTLVFSLAADGYEWEEGIAP